MILQYSMGNESRQKSYRVIKTKVSESLPFVVTGLGDFVCDNTYFVERSGMEQCLLIYSIDGEGRLIYNDQNFTIRPGQVMLIDCRKNHYYATQNENWHFLWIHFQGKCAFDYEDMFNAVDAAPLGVDPRWGLRDYFDTILSHAQNLQLNSELEMAMTMQKLLTRLICTKNTKDFSQKYGGYQLQLEESIAYLSEHFRESISVEMLAKLCGLSKYYYIKVFRAYTGQTPYDHLINLRMQKAQSMLTETLDTVEEIALAVGFSESKNFIACFKKRTGITPMQFRKLHK